MIEKGYDKTPGFLSDHPTLKSRVEIADKRAAELSAKLKDERKPPVASETAFRQIQARANQLAQTTPDDQSLKNSKTLLQALPRSCMVPDEPVPQDAKAARVARGPGRRGGLSPRLT